MYPDLSYILHTLIGTQPDNVFSIVKTFGLLLVTAILVAAFMLYKELIRKEEEGLLKPIKTKVVEGAPATLTDLIGNGLLGFILGFKFLYILFNFEEFQFDPAGLVLSAKGNFIGGLLGAGLFAWLKYWEKNKAKLTPPRVKEVMIYPNERIGDITIIAALSGILGAKLFAIGEDLSQFMLGKVSFDQMIDQLLSGGGLAIYGGLIGGFIAVFIYLKRHKIPPIHVMDAVAPALIVAYGVGRIGCQLSGDGDWGIINELAKPDWLTWLPDALWAQTYPHNVINEGSVIEGCTWRYCSELDQARFPTPIYETVMAFAIGGFLWGIRKRLTIPGILFFIYVLLNGFERFWIEKIRVNDDHNYLGMQMTQAEFIAIILMLIGIVGIAVLYIRSKNKVKPSA